jgi:prevent-host-death family protein
MRTVGAYEAKTHLPRLLDEVARGETITITRHGVPVARLVPAPNQPGDPEVLRRIEEWEKYRKEQNITLGPDITLKEFMEGARRH